MLVGAGGRHAAANALWRNTLLVRETAPTRILPAFAATTTTTTGTTTLRLASSSAHVSSIQEQDVVLLKRVHGKAYQSLTKPLKRGRKIETHFGSLDEGDIVGKSHLETVVTSTGQLVRIHAPTLAEYVTLTPRKVTPVYPSDANLIVSLLDIHIEPSYSSGNTAPRLEILEAGTGHGSLTLHLARAIHAANPRRLPSSSDSQDESLSEWKGSRAAVIHTIDRSAAYSEAAQKIVAGFRRGIYAGNVDFHVGNVTDFISDRMHGGTSPPFSHVILDLPGVHNHVAAAARGLREGGTLIVFCPSVTQVAQCAAAVREQHIPLVSGQFLEIGPSLSGGKSWDIRAAKIRNPDIDESATSTSSGSVWKSLTSWIAQLVGVKGRSTKPSERWETVCRPSVGYMVSGGGFVGVWTRKRERDTGEELSAGTANGENRDSK